MKKILLLLFAASTLFSREFYAPDPAITPDKEKQFLINCGQTKRLPLSEALKELCAGITDAKFDEAFYNRLAHLEEAKYNGEYKEVWPNGQKRMTATYVDGVVDGHVHGWYPDGGEAFKAYYDKGLKIGIHLAFFEKEKRVTSDDPIARFLIYDFQGRLDGEQFAKHYDNMLKALVVFKKGRLVGTSGTWDEHHNKLTEERHQFTWLKNLFGRKGPDVR